MIRCLLAARPRRLVPLLVPLLLLGGCQRVSNAKRPEPRTEQRKDKPMVTESKNPTETAPLSTPLAVEIARETDDLVWKVRNTSDRPVWAFLLVPSLKNGAMSFADDTAWLEQAPDGALLVRKIDTPIPDDVDVDNRIRSGAVLLKPGESRQGRIRLGASVKLRVPYRSSQSRAVDVSRVIFEVGWLPVREGSAPQLLRADGHEFAYLFSEREPGGQRFARSSPLSW